MYRIILAKISRHVLKKRYNKNFQQYRYASKPAVCPPPKSKNYGAYYTLGLLTIVGGGTIGYAKYDPDFREWLCENVPYMDGFLAFLFQEEKTYLQSFTTSLDSLKEKVSGMLFTHTKQKDLVEKPKNYNPPSPAFTSLASAKEDDQYTEIRIEQKLKDEDKVVVTIEGDQKPKETILEATHPKKILEIEERLCEAASSTVQAYNSAVYALKNYNNDIQVVVENSVEQLDPSIWNSLRIKTKAKEETLQSAEQLAKKMEEEIKAFEEVLEDPKLCAPDTIKQQANLNIEKIRKDVKKAKKEFEDARKETNLTDKYWRKVEEARNHFIDEIQILFPSVNVNDRKMSLQGEDLDLFILHAFSNVLFYQKELYKLQVIEQQKVKMALENARRALRVQSEKDLRHQLKIQSEAFADHLYDALQSKEEEMQRDFARMLDEKVTAEKCKFKLQVSSLAARVKGMDQAFKERADSDRIMRNSQILWSTCQNLFKALRAGCPGLPWTEQLRPLEPEIIAVKNAAAKGDELVNAVIEAIRKLRSNEEHLALVPDGGARLPLHILSFIHSLLLVKAATPIPQAELNDETVDFTDFSTNDILQRARYWSIEVISSKA
ncbi:hypothetical protein FQR65_LT11646 [Abscondita terminalis]|nr:hypothetical protein FQR65_LT11646 [Abscondita terminalis]